MPNLDSFFASMFCASLGTLGVMFLYIEGVPKTWQKIAVWVWILFWLVPPLGKLWATAVFQ